MLTRIVFQVKRANMKASHQADHHTMREVQVKRANMKANHQADHHTMKEVQAKNLRRNLQKNVHDIVLMFLQMINAFAGMGIEWKDINAFQLHPQKKKNQ